MTLLGVLGLLIAVFLLAVSSVNKQIDKANAQREENGKRVKPGVLGGLSLSRGGIVSLFFASILLIVAGISNPLANNDAGNRQVVQTVDGDLWVKFTPGWYWCGFFSKVTTWPNNVTVQVSAEDKRSQEADYWEKRHSATFAEGDNAYVSHTVKWDLPVNEVDMLELHTTYNNIDNLKQTTLIQYQKETASYSCQRMTSEEHYSGGQSQLKDYFQDQLRNGQVLLVTETKVKTLPDSSTKTYIITDEKRDQNGNILRTVSDIQKYNLFASFASIDRVSYDKRIYAKLKDKIDAAADEATSKQRLITAQQEEQEAIVKGRKLIAEVTAKEEADERQSVIRARKAKQVEQENAEKAKYIALKVQREQDAKAAANRALRAAGLTPQEEAEWDYKTRVGIAAELAKVKVPNVVVTGGGNGGASPMDALGIKMLMDIEKSLSK